MIEIVPFVEAHLPGLADLTNRHLALVPPREGRIGVRTLRTVFWRYGQLWRQHYTSEPDEMMHRTLVLLADGVPVAYALVQWNQDDQRGHLPLFLANPGRSDAGPQLLDAAADVLRSLGCTTIEVGARSPVGIGWSGIPETWEHLIAMYERAGFAWIDGWLILTGDARSIAAERVTPPPVGWHVLWTTHEDRGEWRLDVYNGEDLTGECDVWGVPPHLAGCPGYDRWVVVEWLGVEEKFRGRGLGKWLVARQMHHHAHAGAERVMLWTGPGNTAALSLYRRLGFAEGPATRVYRRSL